MANKVITSVFKKNDWKAFIVVVSIIFLSILLYLNQLHPVLRISGDPQAKLVFIVISALAILLIVSCFLFKNLILFWLSFSFSIVLNIWLWKIIITIMLGLMFFMTSSDERLNTIDMKNYNVNVYRLDAGAVTSFGVAIYQEKTIFPGLHLVKRLYASYDRYEVEYRITGVNDIDVDVFNDGEIIDKEHFTLKRFVYF